MLQFLIPVIFAGWVAIKIYKVAYGVETIPPTILEENFVKLNEVLKDIPIDRKIVIIGQPGSGKSSVLRSLSNNRCKPLPKVGQDTDTTSWNTKLKSKFFHKYMGKIFVDTPGYDTKNHPVDSYIRRFPFDQFNKVLIIISGKIHHADERILKHLEKIYGDFYSEKLILVRSFSDTLNRSDKVVIEEEINLKFEISKKNITMKFLSNKSKAGVKPIKKILNIN